MDQQNQEPLAQQNTQNQLPPDVQSEVGNNKPLKWFIVGGVIIIAGLGAWLAMLSMKPKAPASNQEVSNNNSNQTTMNNELKAELETAYNKVRAVITSKGDHAALSVVFEENTDPELPPLPDNQWPYVLQTMERGFPDLSELTYISSELNGDYAFYFAYMNAEGSDKDKYYLVWNYIFHKTESGWKLTGLTLNETAEKTAASEEANKNIQTAVESLRSQAKENLKNK